MTHNCSQCKCSLKKSQFEGISPQCTCGCDIVLYTYYATCGKNISELDIFEGKNIMHVEIKYKPCTICNKKQAVIPLDNPVKCYSCLYKCKLCKKLCEKLISGKCDYCLKNLCEQCNKVSVLYRGKCFRCRFLPDLDDNSSEQKH